MDIMQSIAEENDNLNSFFNSAEKRKNLAEWIKDEVNSISSISKQLEVQENLDTRANQEKSGISRASGKVVNKNIKYDDNTSYLGLHENVWHKLNTSEKIKTLMWYRDELSKRYDLSPIPMSILFDKNIPAMVASDYDTEHIETYDLENNKKQKFGLYINPRYLDSKHLGKDIYILYDILSSINDNLVDRWVTENKEAILTNDLNAKKQQILDYLIDKKDINSEKELKKKLKSLVKNSFVKIKRSRKDLDLEVAVWNQEDINNIKAEPKVEKNLAIFGNQPMERARRSAFEIVCEYIASSERFLKMVDNDYRLYNVIKSDLGKVYDNFYSKHINAEDKDKFYYNYLDSLTDGVVKDNEEKIENAIENDVDLKV